MPSSPSRIVVIGSANMDLVVKAERLPEPGETVLGGHFFTAAGGKGANQAVAASRLGGSVHFAGRVGADAFGSELRAGLSAAGVDVSLLVADGDHATGVALIGIDAIGRNSIIVAPGANGAVSPADIDAASEVIAAADCLLMQLEIPADTVKYAMAVARRHGVMVALNPAPIGGLMSAQWIRQVDLLTPNEREAAALLDVPYSEDLPWHEMAAELQRQTGNSVVITLGAAGCLAAQASGVERIPAEQVVAADTTAAGDCFSGALVVALTEGMSLLDACRFASKAAAISTTRLGAQASIPTRAETDGKVHDPKAVVD